MQSAYLQLDNLDEWLDSTDRNFKVGDRVVHLFLGNCKTGSCPTRGALIRESETYPGSFTFLPDNKAKGKETFVIMDFVVKEYEFDAKGLVADN